MKKGLFTRNNDRYKVPRKIRDVIPINRMWEDGIFLSGKNYTKTFKFEDINYYVASREDKEKMFLKYSDLLNCFDSEATTKITINNRRINRVSLEEKIIKPLQGDDLDIYREEYNQMLMEKAMKGNGIEQEKYVTVSVEKKNIEEARSYFSRIETDLISHFGELNSKCTPMDATEKLKIIHDFYRIGDESSFAFDAKQMVRRGHDFRDYICPDIMERYKDYMIIGDKYARVLFLKDFASFIKDEMLSEIMDLNRNMMMSIDVHPVTTDEAVRQIEGRLLSVETDIARWQRRQNANNNFSAVIPYDMELRRKETKEFLNDITTRDQRMMFATITLVHVADTKEQLDSDTETLLTSARKYLCQLATLKYQQLDGLNTALPFGVQKINIKRTLTTESLAVFMPFRAQEIREEDGIYFGENAITHNLILCNLNNLMNQSMFLLGVPGSGKSFFAKILITFFSLFCPQDDVLICDPEGEYSALVEALHGSVIHISAGGKDHINAMEMVRGYGEENSVADKSQFIMSLIEQIDPKGVGPYQKSIIDRCARTIYKECDITGEVPTLMMLRDELLRQPEQEARKLALSLELYTSGSLDIFAHETNVDTSNRIISYDIHGLGEQLKTAGLLTITDAILNRVTLNWRKGKRTHIFIDEFHIVFENEYSAEFVASAWRQFRKRNAAPCAITQNVVYILSSILACTMLANSEVVIMMNQASSDREQLGHLLTISPEQMSYITNADAGCGLIKYGAAIVPFVNKFPKTLRLYKLMTTKPGEGVFSQSK